MTCGRRGLAATPMGEQVHDRVRAQRTQVLSERLDQLSPETAETLLAAVPAGSGGPRGGGEAAATDGPLGA